MSEVNPCPVSSVYRHAINLTRHATPATPNPSPSMTSAVYEAPPDPDYDPWRGAESPRESRAPKTRSTS